MKTFKLYLCIVLFAVPVCLSAFNHNLHSDGEYWKAIESILVKLDSSKTANDYQQCRNSFERVANKYNKEWLAVYYTAYADLQMLYLNPKDANNSTRLSDTKLLLEKLNSFNDADESEVSTLWGYYYTALIMLDPQVNGQKYYNEVMRSYEKGMELNTKNPRPIFLLAFFEQNLPPFLQSKRVFCDEMAKAKELYAMEEKTITKPYWGLPFLEMVAAKCDVKQ